jgi:hypothetical protein
MDNTENMNRILGRTAIETEIKDFLLNFNNTHTDKAYKRGIYIYGSAGVGKTHFITSLLTDMGYDIISYNAGDVRNKALIDSLTSNNMSNNNVLHLMYNVSKKIAVIMDEIDGINLGDKGGIPALIKIIRQKKTKKQKLENMCSIPIICIGSYYTDKKMKELINVCNTYELKPPTAEQAAELIKWIIPRSVYLPEEIQHDIVNYVKPDLRKLFFFKNLCDNKPELLADVKLLNCILEHKNVNDNAKQLTRLFINNNYPLKLHDKMINDTDRTTTSLLFHENIIDALSCFNRKDAINFYSKFLDNMCFSDYIDKITFQNQTWIFNEMSSIMKIFKNNHLFYTDLVANTDTNTKETQKKGGGENPGLCKYNIDEIRFTKILTKYSTEYNNQNFLFDICQKMEMDKKDLLLFFNVIKNNKYKNMDMDMVMDVTTNAEFNMEILTELDINRMFRFLDKKIKNTVVYSDDIDGFVEGLNGGFINDDLILSE